MSLVIFLKCNATGCDTLLPVEAQTVYAARGDGRVAGWTTRTYYPIEGGSITEDRCPTHTRTRTDTDPLANEHNVPAVVTDRVPPSECHNLKPGAAQPCLSRTPGRADRPEEVAVWDWCGHDALGHRMANILIREGYGTVDKVVGAELPEMLNLRGFGKTAALRWKSFKESHAAS